MVTKNHILKLSVISVLPYFYPIISKTRKSPSMTSIISFLFLGIFISNISAIDEKQILQSEIRRNISRRNYAKAELIYQELSEKYPTDQKLIQDRITNLIRMNELTKANKILVDNKSLLNQLQYYLTDVKILGKQRDLEQIEKKTIAFTHKKDFSKNDFNKIVTQVQGVGLYILSKDLIEEYRSKNKNTYEFALIQARNYEYSNNIDLAVHEYLKQLEANNSYLHYVTNRIKTFLKNESVSLETLKTLCENHKNAKIRQLYGNALKIAKNYDEALLVYQSLDKKELLTFAKEMEKIDQDQIALQALEFYKTKAGNQEISADLSIALIYIKKKDYDNASIILKKISQIKGSRRRNRDLRIVPFVEAQKLLAEINLRTFNLDQAVDNLNQAQKINTNYREKLDLKIRMIKIKMLQGKDIKEDLVRLKIHKSYKQEIVEKMYMEYLSIPAIRDSLVTELVTFYGDSPKVGEVLFWEVLVKSENTEFQKIYWDAYKFKETFQYEKAFNLLNQLDSLSQVNGFSELLKKEWKIDKNYHNVDDQLFAGYLLLTSEAEKKEIKEFIEQNPNHVFASGLRVKLQEMENNNES